MEVLFASCNFNAYEHRNTIPQKFKKMLKGVPFEHLSDKSVAIKMHVGRGIGYTTIHPMMVKLLVDRLKETGARPFVTDQSVDGASARGYTEDALGCKVVDVCSLTGKYYYEKYVDFKSFKNVDIAGCINDADALVNLSHVKGHGVCGYGGACKNLAMGCVTDRTRQQIHGLEGKPEWDESLCNFCDACVRSCNHYANSFNDGKYQVNMHHCTFCQHCTKVCPTGALKQITDKAERYVDFQKGMALATQEVLKVFPKENVYHINFLTNITAICDCWGMSTPAVVPDIGVLSSSDIVAVERASLDMIKLENLLVNGVPNGVDLRKTGEGHLFERLHGKNPFVQLDELEGLGLGSQMYELKEIK